MQLHSEVDGSSTEGGSICEYTECQCKTWMGEWLVGAVVVSPHAGINQWESSSNLCLYTAVGV